MKRPLLSLVLKHRTNHATGDLLQRRPNIRRAQIRPPQTRRDVLTQLGRVRKRVVPDGISHSLHHRRVHFALALKIDPQILACLLEFLPKILDILPVFLAKHVRKLLIAKERFAGVRRR